MSRLRSLTFSTAFIALIPFWNPASAQTVSGGLTIVSGNGQAVWEQFRTTVPMVVQARTSTGAPIPNLPVTWSITQGQGTLAGAEPRTDANGLASTYFVATSVQNGLSFAGQTITASTSVGSVNFVITTVLSRLPQGGIGPMPLVDVLSPPQENRNLAGRAGSTIPNGFRVQVVALAGPQQGFPIPNVGIKIVDGVDPTGPSPAQCVGTPLTNAQGIVSCDIVLTGAPGVYFIAAHVGEFQITPNAYLTITPSGSCSFSVSPASANVAAPGGIGSVALTGTSNCGWTASSNANWILITSGFSGTGSGSVSYSVSPNAGIQRSGTLTIAGQTFTINQAAPGSGGALSISSGPTLPSAILSAAYTFTVAANGGTQPYTYSAPSGVPPGLALNTTSGVISGTPSALGNYSFPITVRDNAGQSQTQTFALSVVSATSGTNPVITNGSFPNGAVGSAYSQLLTSVGGCSNPFSPAPVFSITSGALPPGLAIQGPNNDRTTRIAGTPTTNGSYSFTLQVTDICGRSGSSNFSIVIGTGGGNPNPTPGSALVPGVSQLQFTIQTGAASSVSQILGVTSNGAMSFTAQAQSLSGFFNWLTISPAGGSTPANLNVSASAVGLPPGTYTGSITLVPSGTTVGAVSVPVTLRVLAPPAVSPLPTSLFFLYQPGTPPSGGQTLNIASTGAAFAFTASTSTESGGNWLFVTPSSSTTPGVLTAAVNPLGLNAGTYRGAIHITPASAGIAPLSIPVTLSIPQVGPVVSSIVNAASFAPGPISPGEFVTIFGTNLGPRELVPAHRTAAGLLDTALAETRVYFDNTPAPVIYSSDRQVSVIVPYSVNGRAFTRIEVEYRGQRSTGVDLRVVDSSPALFTVSPTQAAAVNQDGSVNSQQNPAEAGSIIALYATGEGQTDPPGVDGRFMDETLAKPLLPVSAQVAGRDAEILYAGSAPSLPSGMIQINVRIPDGTPPGAANVVVTIGRTTTQAGVSIFVK